jgi:ribonuclease D|tara:strand:+ start:1726 stop:2340 length:615 start_codon:yes stop_codon:yes gene_type:complete
MQTHLYKNDLKDNISFGNIIAIDTEAMGLDPARDRLCLIQLYDGKGDCHMVQFENDHQSSPNLVKLLVDQNIQKIFHYARFDMAALKHALKIDVKNIYCTKIASKIARTYTNNHGLKDLCKELLNIEISKKQQSSDWGNVSLSKDQIVYAANDVIHLHAIKNKLDSILIRENRQPLVDACINFLPTRVELDLRGWENDIFSHSS